MTLEQLRLSRPRSVPASVRMVAVAVCFVAAAFVPDVAGLYWVRVLSNILMFVVITQSINIIAGFVGYPAFGNVVFFGLGAYGTAIAMVKLEAPFPLAMLSGLLLCTIVVIAIGPPLMRLKGHYFAIATLGLNEAIKAVVNNVTDITGGGMGLSLPLPEGSTEAVAAYFYRAMLLLVMIGLGASALIQSTRFGYACRAIRANEEGANSLGINTTWYKTMAWLISALLAGAAGALYAQWLAYIEPSVVFDMTIAVKAFVMFLLGGPATIFGPLVGAAVVEMIATLSWSHLLRFHLGVLGLLIMVSAVAMPTGIQAFAHDRFSYLRRLLQPAA